jgi:Tetratricopeptide repeat
MAVTRSAASSPARQLAVVQAGPPHQPLRWGTASDQVVTGNVPQEPSCFQSRADLLTELDRTGAGVSVVHAVTGMPGMGTTHLAAAYARAKLAEGWRLVAWINAGNTGSLQAGLAAVADSVGLSNIGPGLDATDAGSTVRHYLETEGDRCLLVFDDARDPDALRPFIPVSGAARVLITSARQSVVNLGTSVPVEAFAHEEALAFLAGRTGLSNEAGAAVVADELGHVPLALAQAAAVIGGEHLGYGTYLDRLWALSARECLGHERTQAYPYRTAEAVLLSLEAVLTTDQADICAPMMQIIAVLSPAEICRELLYAAGQAGVLSSGGEQVAALQVDRALERLAERSLLTFSLDGQGVIVHPLITRVIRDKLARTEELTTACQAAASVLATRVKQLEGSQDRQALRDIPQQIVGLHDNTVGLAVETDEELTKLLLRLRLFALYYLIELGGSVPQAIAVGEPLTADLEWMLGPDHPDTLRSRNSLAVAYQEVGRVSEAILLLEQTLFGRERVHGPKHPDTLTTQHNLAASYQRVGRDSEAIRLFELTLGSRERVLGIDHPDTVRSRNDLANAYWEMGRVAEAIPLLQEILLARERVLGPEHPDTLSLRNSLALAHREAGPAEE